VAPDVGLPWRMFAAKEVLQLLAALLAQDDNKKVASRQSPVITVSPTLSRRTRKDGAPDSGLAWGIFAAKGVLRLRRQGRLRSG